MMMTLAGVPSASRPSAARRTMAANSPDESSAGSTCWSVISLSCSAWSSGIPSFRERARSVPKFSSNTNMAVRSPRAAAATANCEAIVDLPVPAGPSSSVLVPAGSPPPSNTSSRALPLGKSCSTNSVTCSAATRRGKTSSPPRANREVVITAAKRHAAQLADAQPAPLGAVLIRELLEHDDAVRDALQLIVFRPAGAIVEHQDRAVAAGEILLQRENLPAIAQRILRDQPQLRQRVDDDALRPQVI